MPSLNIDLDFFDHPKTKRLKALLGPEAEIYLIRLWAYAGKFHTEDGVLKNYESRELAMLAGFSGKAEAMLQAMLKVGFLDRAGKWYKVHDWRDHEGHLVTYKERARMGAAARWGNRDNKESLENGDALGNASSNAHTNSTNKAVQSSTNKQARAPFVLPDWIDPVVWAAYLEIRKAKRAAKTNYALELIIKDLEKFKAQGHNPKEILENSIKSGWTGVFLPRPGFKGASPSGCPPIPGKYDGIGEKA